MSRSADLVKRREWSERLRRFSGCDATVAEFCDEEGVSIAAFYQWRRKLGLSEGSTGASGKNQSGGALGSDVFVPLQITPSATTVRMRLPNGVELWLPAGDARTLTVAIEAAARLAVVVGEEAAC